MVARLPHFALIGYRVVLMDDVAHPGHGHDVEGRGDPQPPVEVFDGEIARIEARDPIPPEYDCTLCRSQGVEDRVVHRALEHPVDGVRRAIRARAIGDSTAS